jgi:large subunit ribosomal protein L10
VTRLEKHQLVEEFGKTTASYAFMVVVRQTRINASATALLRKGAHEAGVLFRVVKNRLAKRALSHCSQEFGEALSGPTAIFMSQDPVSLAKLLMDFSKK